MNHQTFHAHFFRNATGAWCVSVRMPDGARTMPHELTPVQLYELLPWLDALGIGYEHLVDHGQGIEYWIAEAFERLEKQRARARRIEHWEVALWWIGILSILLAVCFLFLGLGEAAIAAAVAYFPIAFCRDGLAREAAHFYRPLRPISPDDKKS